MLYTILAMTSVVPSKKYSNFTSEESGRSKNSANFYKVDESEYAPDLGWDIFPYTYNLTDLYIDPFSSTYDLLYFAPVGDPSNHKELLDYDGLNFGINTEFTPLAIEVVTDPSNGLQYVGTNLLLAYDHFATGSDDPLFNQYSAYVGFLFDQNGQILSDLGPPVDNKGINDLENLFGFDVNGDGKQGGLPINHSSNLVQINELQELKNLGYQTFNSSRNIFTDLWVDTANGDIYTNMANVPEDQILLKYTGNSEFSDYED